MFCVYVMIGESGSHPYFSSVTRSDPTKPSFCFLRTPLLFSFHIHSSFIPIQSLYIYPNHNHAHNPPLFFATFLFSIPLTTPILLPCPLLSTHPDSSSTRFWPNLSTKGTELLSEEALEGDFLFCFCISSILHCPFHHFSFFFLSGAS